MDGQALAAFLSKQYGVPEASPLELNNIPDELIRMIPRAAADKLCILPLSKNDDGLVVAMMDPSDENMLKKIEGHLGFKLTCKIASELEIRKGLKKHYGIGLTPRFLHLLSQKENAHFSHDPTDENLILEQHLDKIISASEAIQYYFAEIKSLDRVPVVDYVGDITRHNLNSALIFIFQQVDGMSTIQDIISMNMFTRLSMLRALVYFSKLGMIRFMEVA